MELNVHGWKCGVVIVQNVESTNLTARNVILPNAALKQQNVNRLEKTTAPIIIFFFISYLPLTSHSVSLVLFFSLCLHLLIFLHFPIPSFIIYLKKKKAISLSYTHLPSSISLLLVHPSRSSSHLTHSHN